jgi:hypothetical protein
LSGEVSVAFVDVIGFSHVVRGADALLLRFYCVLRKGNRATE